jgi:hypothetical protein
MCQVNPPRAGLVSQFLPEIKSSQNVIAQGQDSNVAAVWHRVPTTLIRPLPAGAEKTPSHHHRAGEAETGQNAMPGEKKGKK